MAYRRAERDARLSIPLDPETALRGLLALDLREINAEELAEKQGAFKASPYPTCCGPTQI